MSLWLYINLSLFFFVLTSIFYRYAQLPFHIIVGLVGLFLILFNWTRHAVFSTIRQTADRQKKIKLANLSKQVMPFHRWVGTIALLVIGLHAGLAIARYGWIWSHEKFISGLLAGLGLFFMVFTGWLRLYFPSGRKRRAHLYIGFCLFFPCRFTYSYFLKKEDLVILFM